MIVPRNGGTDDTSDEILTQQAQQWLRTLGRLVIGIDVQGDRGRRYHLGLSGIEAGDLLRQGRAHVLIWGSQKGIFSARRLRFRG